MLYKVIQTKDLHYFLKINKKDNLNIIDLGINNGSFSIDVYNIYNKRINIYGVEANKEIKIDQKYPFKVYNYLISKKSGLNEKFFIDENETGSSSAIFSKKNQKFCLVPTISLYDFYISNKLEKNGVDILKIDIEGKEYEILNKEMISFLSKNTNQICIEFHDFLKQGEVFKEETLKIFKIFENYNFKRFNFSLNNGSVLFVNLQKLKINFLQNCIILFDKYRFGILRKIKKLFLIN